MFRMTDERFYSRPAVPEPGLDLFAGQTASVFDIRRALEAALLDAALDQLALIFCRPVAFVGGGRLEHGYCRRSKP